MNAYLQTERVLLRGWADSDFEDFARINADPLIMEFYPGRLDDKGTRKLMDKFQAYIAKHKTGFFALENKQTGAFMGFAGLAPVPPGMSISPAIEIAWRIDYEFWGQGYATEIANALIDHAKADLSLEKIIAYCDEGNERAAHVLDKIGFQQNLDGNFSYKHGSGKGVVKDYILFEYALA